MTINDTLKEAGMSEEEQRKFWREALKTQDRRLKQEAWLCRLLQIVLVAFVVWFVWCLVTPCDGADWITAPSYYTHKDGERVTQHTPIGPFYHQPKQDQGGWSRSVIRGPDGSVDVYWSGTYRGIVSPYLDFGNTSRVRMPWDDPGPVNNPWPYRAYRDGFRRGIDLFNGNYDDERSRPYPSDARRNRGVLAPVP
jgi:hypothetical protein